jgi:hypothetical protein
MKTNLRSLLETCAAFGILFFLLGCATNTGVVQLSGNTYMISKSDAAGAFSNLGALKAGVIQEANAFAESKGKVAVARNTNMTIPAHGFPTFEYQFELLDKDDPRANGVTLNPRPDYVVEKIDKVDANIKTKDTTEKGPPDLYAELTKLDDLRKKGIITDAEFDAQKKKLLSESN